MTYANGVLNVVDIICMNVIGNDWKRVELL